MATIYFSGSISGGREDAALYRRLVAALEEAGHRVLAGQVTNTSLGHEGEHGHAPAIFERDMAWLREVAREGGVLVAEVSKPSVGVGYEIGAARYLHGLRVICLYRPAHTRRCSAMVAGDPAVETIEYTDESLGDAVMRLLAAIDRERE